MTLDRKAIYAALFAVLKRKCNAQFNTIARKGGLATYSGSQLPALVLRSGAHDNEQPVGMPPKWTLRAAVGIFAAVKESDPAPDEQLFDLVKAVDAALEGETLGGLVRSAYLVNEDYTEGELGGEGFVAITIEMLAVKR